jgi:hypothetical protein
MAGNFTFLISGLAEPERAARWRELRVLALVCLGLRHSAVALAEANGR